MRSFQIKNAKQQELSRREIVRFLPLTQGIAMMKNAFLGINAGSVLLPVCVMPGRTALCTVLSVRFFRREQRFDPGSITPFSLTDRKEIFIIYNSAASMNIRFIWRMTLWECRLQH